MRSLFGFVAILKILITLTQINAVHGRNVAEKCPVLSPKDVKTYNCGKQFVPAVGLANDADKKASIVKEGEFPWSVVLMRKSNTDPTGWKYLCGGTLISSNNVLTAAHCIRSKGSPFQRKAENIKVVLGAFSISDANEQCRKEVELDSYLIHSGWNSEEENKFTDDIALLKLKNKIEFTERIFPICLKNSTEIRDIKNGIVAGYGEFNETRGITSDVPVKVKLSIVEDKLWVNSEHRSLSKASWFDSFVAGSETAGVCPGDSGSGFYVYSKKKFYLRGLVSAAQIEEGYNCTHNNYALYTDVLKYFDSFNLKESSNSPGSPNAPDSPDSQTKTPKFLSKDGELYYQRCKDGKRTLYCEISKHKKDVIY